jgi:hypothetical protein
MVPVRKGPDAVPACHDSVDSQPKTFSTSSHERCLQPHTRQVAQEFLIFWRSKFRYPMVLPSGSGRPAGGCESRSYIEVHMDLIDIDAISASEAMTRLMPINDQMYDQKSPARPPSTSPWVFALWYKSAVGERN